MKIRGVKAQQQNEAARGVTGAGGANSGHAEMQAGLSQEFRSIMASFAGAGSAAAGTPELDFEAFEVEAIKHEPTEMQMSMQSGSIAHGKSQRDAADGSEQQRSEVEYVELERAEVVSAGSKEDSENKAQTQTDAGEVAGEQAEVSQDSVVQEFSQQAAGENKAVETSAEEDALVVAAEAVVEQALDENAVPVDTKSAAAELSHGGEASSEQHSAQSVDQAKVVSDSVASEAPAILGADAVAHSVAKAVEVKTEVFTAEVVQSAPVAQAPVPNVNTSQFNVPTNFAFDARVSRSEGFERSVLNGGKEGIAALNGAQAKSASSDSPVNMPMQARDAQAQAEMKAVKPQVRSAVLKNMERIEGALKEVAKSHDGKTISLRLDPPDLGAVKVDVSLRDGSLHARVVAESAAVAQVVREKAQELQGVLRKLGLDCERVSVSVHQEGSSSGGQSASQEQAGHSNRGQSNGAGSHDVLAAQAVRPEVVSKQLDHWVA